ncbi:hypothetical protein MY1884_006497 [Beauveria asiatica]
MRISVDTSVLGRFPVALLFWNVAYGETVPFSNGLTLGQGLVQIRLSTEFCRLCSNWSYSYNTYLNQGCRHNAINVSLKPDSSLHSSRLITEPFKSMNTSKQLVSVLETSAGAAVKASVESGPSTGTTASFLDNSSFESSFLTYVVKVDMEKQTSSDASFALNWDNAPDTSVYCDRFISHFAKGGALFTRVDIKTTDSSKHKAMKQSVNVKITESFKTSITEIQKSSEVNMQFIYISAPSDAQQTVSGNGSGGDAAQLVQLKTIADNFLARAKDSNITVRFSINMSMFQTRANSSKSSTIPQQRIITQSWSVFEDSSSYQAMQAHLPQMRFEVDRAALKPKEQSPVPGRERDAFLVLGRGRRRRRLFTNKTTHAYAGNDGASALVYSGGQDPAEEHIMCLI